MGNDSELIKQIAQRAVWDLGFEMITVLMDLDNAIQGGLSLNLQGLLKASRIDFAHDIIGIHNNLDHETFQLNNFFLPRYAIN